MYRSRYRGSVTIYVDHRLRRYSAEIIGRHALIMADVGPFHFSHDQRVVSEALHRRLRRDIRH